MVVIGQKIYEGICYFFEDKGRIMLTLILHEM